MLDQSIDSLIEYVYLLSNIEIQDYTKQNASI